MWLVLRTVLQTAIAAPAWREGKGSRSTVCYVLVQNLLLYEAFW